MGILVFLNLVKKKNNKVITVEKPDMPKINQIDHLYDLISYDELKESLINIADNKLDLSFFLKINASVYGETEYENTSFSPSKVIETINLISKAFKNNGNKFIKPVQYIGAFDKKGYKLLHVFIEKTTDEPTFKNKAYILGTISVSEEGIILESYQQTDQLANLITEKPVLFYAKMDENDAIKRKEQIEWEIKAVKFYDKIKPELANIKELAEYAQRNNLELQITEY